jgi:uncharacterized protein (DUF885 family)
MKQSGDVLVLLTLVPWLFLQATSPGTVEGRRKALADALEEQWQYTLRTSPEYASILGDKRYNDQIDDDSIEAVRRDLEKTRYFWAKFQAIDVSGFPEQEVLNKRLMIRDLEETLAGERFKNWEMPVNQMNGIHISKPRLVSLLSFRS